MSKKTTASERPSPEKATQQPVAEADFKTLLRASVASFLAWLVPGAGHLFLVLPGRAAYFCVLIFLTMGVGWGLEGLFPWTFSGSPLPILATLGCLGSGLPALALKFGFSYQGNFDSATFEYGYAFLLSAGLMNLMLALDAFDIAMGRKE